MKGKRSTQLETLQMIAAKKDTTMLKYDEHYSIKSGTRNVPTKNK